MSNVYSLEEALEDTATLVDVASQAGISTAEAKLVVAALANLPITQVMRICSAAYNDRVRQINRNARKR